MSSKNAFHAAPDALVDSGSRLTTASNVLIKCGDCLHFAGSPHPSKGELCKGIGIKKFANAPNCYTANVHVFRKTSPQAFAQLAALVSSFSGSEARVLVGLLRQQSKLERKGLTFLERVYFLLGKEYLDNFVCGYALGVGPDGEILIVGHSYFSNQKSSIVAQLDPTSVIREKEFKQTKARLLGAGKLYEPRKVHKNDGLDEAAYQPPTMETSPEFLEKMAKGNKKPRGDQRVRRASADGVLEIDLSGI